MRFDPKSWGKLEKFAQVDPPAPNEPFGLDIVDKKMTPSGQLTMTFDYGGRTIVLVTSLRGGHNAPKVWVDGKDATMPGTPERELVDGIWHEMVELQDHELGQMGKNKPARMPKQSQMGPLEGAEIIYDRLFGSDGQSPLAYLPDRVNELAAEHPEKSVEIKRAYENYLDAQQEVDHTFVQNLHSIIGDM